MKNIGLTGRTAMIMGCVALAPALGDDSLKSPRVARAESNNPAALAAVSLERMIELPRNEVWKLIATSEGWKQTFGVDAKVELRPGGKFEILFKPDAPQGQQGSEGCTVLSFIPDQMLSFTWNAPPKFQHARARRTWVVVRLDELGPARTRLRIDHLGFAEQAAENHADRGEWEQVREYFQQAWGKVLDAVKAKESKQ